MYLLSELSPLLLIILLALWTLGGWLILLRFEIPAHERGLLGLGLGLTLSALLANLTARFLPTSLAFWLASLLTLVIGLVLAWPLKSRITHHASPITTHKLPITQWFAFALLAFFLTLIGRGLGIFDDYQNLPQLSGMALGDIPPHFVYDPRILWSYHYFLLLVAAQFTRLAESPPWAAMDLARGLTLALTLFYGAFLARRLTGSRVAAALSAGFLFFVGGARWILLLLPASLLTRISNSVTLIGSGADSGANLAAVLYNYWKIQALGPFPFPFLYGSGLDPSLTMAHAGYGASMFMLVLLVILLFSSLTGQVSGGERLPSPFGQVSGGERLPSPFGQVSGGERLPSPFGQVSGGEGLPSPFGQVSGGEGLPSPFGQVSGGEGLPSPFGKCLEESVSPLPFGASVWRRASPFSLWASVWRRGSPFSLWASVWRRSVSPLPFGQVSGGERLPSLFGQVSGGERLPSPFGQVSGGEGLPSPFGQVSGGEGLPSPFGQVSGGEGLPSPFGQVSGGEGLPSPFGRGAGGEGYWLRQFLLAVLLAALALANEVTFAFLYAGLIFAVLFWVIRQRTLKLPASLWAFAPAVIGGGIIALLQGGVFTGMLLGLFGRVGGTEASEALYKVSFALRLPTVLSAHVGALSFFNPLHWFVILAETGLAVFVLPWAFKHGWKLVREERWLEAAWVFSMIPSLLTIFLEYTGNAGPTALSRMTAHFLMVLKFYAVPLLWLWAKEKSETIRIALLGWGLAAALSGIGLLTLQIPAMPNPIYAEFLAPIDAKMHQKHWGTLQLGALVFDTSPQRGPTVLGLHTLSGIHYGPPTYPEWYELAENPNPFAMNRAGFRYLYLELSYWRKFADHFQDSCVQILDDMQEIASEGRVIAQRVLLDVGECK